MRVPFLNFNKIKPGMGTVSKSPISNSGTLGPKTSRDALKNKAAGLVNSKSGSKIGDVSVNSSINDPFKSISNRKNIISQTPQRSGNYTPGRIKGAL